MRVNVHSNSRAYSTYPPPYYDDISLKWVFTWWCSPITIIFIVSGTEFPSGCLTHFTFQNGNDDSGYVELTVEGERHSSEIIRH